MYGTYQLVDGPRGGEWHLLLDPAIRMRARRVFGKVLPTRSAEVVMVNSIETCRDLAWFMERFPLEAVDARSAELLEQGRAAHVAREAAVAEILDGRAARIPFDVQPAKTPRDYQLAAIDLLRTSQRLLLTDEVGLGKTLTGLLAVAHEDARPALVVPPTHLPSRWETELQESFPTLSYHIAASTKPTGTPGDVDVLIVPYSRLDGWADHLADHMRTVVFDEVQDLRRGAFTNKGMAAARVTENAEYVLGLTATPVYNYGSEIWNLYDILAPGELGSRDEFDREWGGARMPNGQTLVRDPHALGRHLRTEGLMLGRTRKEVGRELPKTIKVPTLVDSNDEALTEAMQRLQGLAENVLYGDSQQDRFVAAGELDMKLRQATGIDKAPFVADFVEELLQSEQRIVLWGWHREVYRIWLEKLADYNPRLYTGSESPKQKHDAELAFTAEYQPDACRVLIMSLRSGAGIDGLQKVSRVGVFGELDWSPQVHEQAIGRLRRDGMGEDPPVVYFLHSNQGSDPVLLETLQLKRQQSEPLVTADGKLFANATTDTNRGRALAEQVLARTTRQKESA